VAWAGPGMGTASTRPGSPPRGPRGPISGPLPATSARQVGVCWLVGARRRRPRGPRLRFLVCPRGQTPRGRGPCTLAGQGRGSSRRRVVAGPAGCAAARTLPGGRRPTPPWQSCLGTPAQRFPGRRAMQDARAARNPCSSASASASKTSWCCPREDQPDATRRPLVICSSQPAPTRLSASLDPSVNTQRSSARWSVRHSANSAAWFATGLELPQVHSGRRGRDWLRAQGGPVVGRPSGLGTTCSQAAPLGCELAAGAWRRGARPPAPTCCPVATPWAGPPRRGARRALAWCGRRGGRP
jgi:hypothetical protein